MPHSHGVDSEVGRLRTVLLHRPGAELARVTSRGGDPAAAGRVAAAGLVREEHDAFAQVLRDHGVEVLYLAELLEQAMAHQPARRQAITSALDDANLGDELRGQVHRHLDGLDPGELSRALIAGLTPGEFRTGRGATYELLGPHDFVIAPLPDLLLTRDSSVWLGGSMAVASPAPARRREAALTQVVYAHHPAFAGVTPLYRPEFEPLEGGDVLLLASGVVAMGIGARTAPAAVERLARRAFDARLAHTVLAVPIGQCREAAHLGTVCAMADVDTLVMHPALAYTLTARTVTPCDQGLQVSRPQPFLEAAALAMGLDHLKVIDTGPGQAAAGREQRDGGDVLAIAPGLAVSCESNAETNARMEAAGIKVIRVPGGRGGPRRMSCPISRDPVRADGAGLGGRPSDTTLIRGDGPPEPPVSSLRFPPSHRARAQAGGVAGRPVRAAGPASP
jgi:arginine deiminase